MGARAGSLSPAVHLARLPVRGSLYPAGVPLTLAGMFFFFSNKLGCLGSILVSLALSALLYLLLRGF